MKANTSAGVQVPSHPHLQPDTGICGNHSPRTCQKLSSLPDESITMHQASQCTESCSGTRGQPCHEEKVWGFSLRISPPWQCSRPGWMRLWATWSGGRDPCSWQGDWKQMVFKVTSNHYHSMILWWACPCSRAAGSTCGKASWQIAQTRKGHSETPCFCSTHDRCSSWKETGRGLSFCL